MRETTTQVTTTEQEQKPHEPPDIQAGKLQYWGNFAQKTCVVISWAHD